MRSRSARSVAYLLLLLSCLVVIVAEARAEIQADARLHPALFHHAPRVPARNALTRKVEGHRPRHRAAGRRHNSHGDAGDAAPPVPNCGKRSEARGQRSVEKSSES